MGAADPITGCHFPNRILFLIDLTPQSLISRRCRSLQSYLDRVLSATKPFLSSPQFSSALFAFKLFFSSLSPLLSSSKLPSPYSSLHLSFLNPSQTLTSLTRALVDLQDQDFASVSASPGASLIAAGLRQILHEYDWGTVLEDDVKGNNLVILFSPVGRSREQVCRLLESNWDDDGGELGFGREDFCSRACEVFGSIRDVFVSKRIHLCWIDVEYEAEEGTVEGVEGVIEFAGFKEGIKRLGWGFCSSESIVLGSTILPFGLIYPNLGLVSRHFRVSDCCRRVRGSLNLEIMDVTNKPLECKCCDIKLVDYKIRDRNQTQASLSQQFVNWHETDMEREDNTYLDRLGNREVRLCFLNVQKHGRFAKLKEQFMEQILVSEYLGEQGNDEKDGMRHEFFADMVLDVLAKDMGEFRRKSPPLWQIILSFMYREEYWALVSLQDEDGKSKYGILKPFTFSSALIFLHDDIADHGFNKVFDTLYSNNGNSEPLCSRKDNKQGETEKRRSKLHLLQNLSWDDFRKEATEGLAIKLEEEFFASKRNQSKKLKFLKCWMKQVVKAANTPPPATIKHLHLESEDNKVTDQEELPRESEHPVSESTSAAEDSMTAASKVQDEVAVEDGVESCDDFLGSIPWKIRQGIELEGADLGALAERLVHSTIYWLSGKYDSELASESQSVSVATELMDLLLSEPKELAEKGKRDRSNSEQDASSSSSVREFELQIFFRMEILRSQVTEALKDAKQRFVKQICVLLECIQCQLEGGFFGDWSLDDYVEKIIKRRYFEALEDVVNQIYSRMDLLLFNGEDEAPLNSEDSYKSCRDDVGAEDVARYLGCGGSNSTEEKFHQDEDHLRRLSDARERRERARRFKSFTSSMPDLLRVWAPKVLTSVKSKADSSKKKLRTRETCDLVLETPSTENKRFCHQIHRPDDQPISTSQPGASVSKALFPEDL